MPLKMHTRLPATVALLAAALVLSLWSCWAYRIFGLSGTDIAERGQFGDAFGALNTLFTGLAFIGVVYTMFLQREELNIAQAEMKSQQGLARLERFESVYFQLLDQLDQIIDGIQFDTSHGRTALNAMVRDYIGIATSECGKDGDVETYTRSFGNWFASNSVQFSHYLRVVVQILKHVDQSSVKNKDRYYGIFRARLSNPEIAILFFSMLNERGSVLKDLAKSAALLKHAPDSLRAFKSIYDHYGPTAFGNPPRE